MAKKVTMPMDYAALENDTVSVQQPVEAAAVQEEHTLKIIQRGISKMGLIPAGETYVPVGVVEAYVSEWLDKGYHLVGAPTYLGEAPEFFNFMFFLVKD